MSAEEEVKAKEAIRKKTVKNSRNTNKKETTLEF
jgi:hypothetical protein